MTQEPEPSKPHGEDPPPPPEPEVHVPHLIYCFDRHATMWDDSHGSCECHKKRYHHRH